MTVTAPLSHTVETFLPASGPFDFDASLRFIRGFPAMTGEQDTGSGALTMAVREHGALVGVRLRAAMNRCGLNGELMSARVLSEPALAAIRDRLRFHLGLDDAVSEFYELAAGDLAFGAVVARLYGYHQVKFPSPLELLCWAILGQRVPMPVARTMKHAIMAEFGNEVVVDGRSMRAFPDLDQLLILSQARLQELIGNSRKAGYLYGSLRQWAETDEAFLRTGEYDAVRDRLLEFPGIGPWSATFLLIRGLGRTERMAPDKEALRAASRVYGHPVGEAEFVELAARYGSWQGYWGHYVRVAG